MAISRLYNHASGDVIEAVEINEEYNQLIAAVNAKPDADGTLQSNLNADTVDGYHATADGSVVGVAVNSGTLITGLNADKVDGFDAADLIEGGFPPGTKLIVYNSEAFYASDLVGGWLDSTPTSGTGTEMIIAVGAGGGFGADGWGNTIAGGKYTSNKWNTNVIATSHSVTHPVPSLQDHNHDVTGLAGQFIDQATLVGLAGGGPVSGGQLYWHGGFTGTGFFTTDDKGGTPTATTESIVGSGAFSNWRPPHLHCLVIEKRA